MKKTALYKGNQTIEIVERENEVLKPEEVRLDVAYCGICGTDRHAFHGVMDGRIGNDAVIGHEMSGIITEIGSAVKDHKIGDAVVVRPLDWCGECPTCKRGFTHICENLKFVGLDSEGAFQSSWNVNQRILHKVPKGVSLKVASLAEPLAVACHDVRRSAISSDDFALIIGGGPIGILIAQVLKNKGVNFVLSEVNETRLSIAQSLGIKTLNPIKQDMAASIKEMNKGSLADVVFEVSASQPGALSMTAFTRPRGKIVLVGIYGKNPEVCLKDFFWKELELFGARVYEARDFDEALAVLNIPEFPSEVIISKIYPLEQMEKAFKDLDEDLSVMKILIQCGDLK
ncbi:alcohol dehydrogenase catalytic domain-containing protein [Oceanispirochaeta sp.]|jgi:(R,R)-butanediol dehydrogenase/meso-butanediol dehydrogenase/diacetyl reductase|uniref:zinc-dependent alcohol dehydrogenase n=1 Tax=Oceanispirochaeta sp. TaxID=2035350 RepID=UPI0026035421|nr:alcohol dehydrogenase catalytic domain-containing protein [Oceanispirochaeta sp.]MDA3955629.1 alcohol dehydrogenase catalytic domain-containing protein [Oceanispirochaeta sp.]